jgi:hypothetical protein
MAETAVISTFFWIAMFLLVGVTGGVGYLTFLEWCDRRRNGQDGSDLKNLKIKKFK